MAVRLYAAESCIVKNTFPAFKTNTAASVSNSSDPAVDAEKIAILFKVNNPSSEYFFKKITEIKVGVYNSASINIVSYGESAIFLPYVYSFEDPYAYDAVSFLTPRVLTSMSAQGIYSLSPQNPSFSGFIVAGTDHPASKDVKGVLNGFFLNFSVRATGSPLSTTFYTHLSGNRPYVDIEFSDVAPYLVPKISTPAASSVINLNKAQIFRYGFDTSHANFAYVGDIYAGTATLKWRDGASGTVHKVNASNLSGQISVPANTFPRSSNLQYRIEITDGGGTTSATDWVNFSTDLQLTASSLSPAGGYVDETVSNTFSWNLNANNTAEFNILMAEASVQLQWRASSSGAVNSISAGSLYSHTVPADTFPSTGSPEWRVKVTDSYGNVRYSSWVTFTTTDSAGTATPTTPVNTIVSGSESTLFAWNYSSPTGSAPSGATIQHSADGSTWENLKTVSGSETSTTVDLSSFSGGMFYWRVQANNNDGEAGPWSDPVSFVLLSSPLTPIVTASQTPRPTVSWQATGQEAYQIVIDGLFNSGSIFGTAKSYKLPILLPDGQYLIKVCVQNSFGLWSEYGTAAVYVSNVPGTAIQLRADRSDYDVSLSWTGGEYSRYLLKRNGQPIGLTTEQSFTDLSALGPLEYSVTGIDDSTDTYTESNTVEICMGIKGPVITALDEPHWLSLQLSSDSSRQISYSKTRNVSYRHVFGAEYPVAEFSNEFDEYVNFGVAMRDRQQADLFEALIGRKVLLKTKDGWFIGVLSGSKTSGPFFRDFDCSIQVVFHLEDYSL